LALAETQREASGKDLINAVVVGNELICRLGLAAKISPVFVRTVTCGSFGAAAAAAKILKLDRDKMLNTLGIVYSQTAGNAQCVLSGALVKRMQPAMAAKAGVISALLAKRGVTGARDIFEGGYGYFRLYERGEYNRDCLFDDLGEKFEQMKLSIKPYPSCRYTHSAIDAAIDITKKYPIETENIREIIVYTSRMVKEVVGRPFEIHENPQVDAQFSIPYTISVALIRGEVSLSDLQESAIMGDKVLQLLKKVEVVVDPAIDELSLMKARIVIKTKDGKSYAQETSAPRGSPERPMSLDECINKFSKCIHFSGNNKLVERMGELIGCITHLEEVTDIRTLSNLLA
jgi:2-methylcitrate dehydratase PrpD